MATQYDPIAKDESLNTTEATPRNIADVLAEGLKGIEDALPPTYTEGDGIDISNDEISVDTTFTEAETRANIASGESLSTIFGKIKKWFSDVAVKNANNNFTENQTIDKKNGTTSTVANSMFSVGNNIPQGTDKNSRGIIGIFSNTAKIALLWAATNLASDINVYLPSKGGTLALTSDLSDTDVYVEAGTFNITVKRTPALIIFRPSNNNVHALVSVTKAGLADVLYDFSELGTVTVNSCTGNVVNITTTHPCGYAVMY